MLSSNHSGAKVWCLGERSQQGGRQSVGENPLLRLEQEHIQELSLLEFGPHFLTQEKLGSR